MVRCSDAEASFISSFEELSMDNSLLGSNVKADMHGVRVRGEEEANGVNRNDPEVGLDPNSAPMSNKEAGLLLLVFGVYVPVKMAEALSSSYT